MTHPYKCQSKKLEAVFSFEKNRMDSAHSVVSRLRSLVILVTVVRCPTVPSHDAFATSENKDNIQLLLFVEDVEFEDQRCPGLNGVCAGPVALINRYGIVKARAGAR